MNRAKQAKGKKSKKHKKKSKEQKTENTEEKEQKEQEKKAIKDAKKAPNVRFFCYTRLNLVGWADRSISRPWGTQAQRSSGQLAFCLLWMRCLGLNCYDC